MTKLTDDLARISHYGDVPAELPSVIIGSIFDHLNDKEAFKQLEVSLSALVDRLLRVAPKQIWATLASNSYIKDEAVLIAYRLGQLSFAQQLASKFSLNLPD